jgi:hypothetical protein
LIEHCVNFLTDLLSSISIFVFIILVNHFCHKFLTFEALFLYNGKKVTLELCFFNLINEAIARLRQRPCLYIALLLIIAIILVVILLSIHVINIYVIIKTLHNTRGQ